MEQAPVILLVEDDANDALITQKALRKAGLTQKVIHMHDGWEAMLYLAGKPPFDDRSTCPLPVLILLDLKMPKYTGIDVLTWLHSRPELTRLSLLDVVIDQIG